MSRSPLGFGQWQQALAYAAWKPREMTIAGDPDSADRQAFLNVVREGYQPFQVVALGAPSNAQIPIVPLLKDCGLEDRRAAAYVCREFACQVPVTNPGVLQSLLEAR